MKCSDCPYLVERENLSLMSRMMGYTSECSQTGVLFNVADYAESPSWCPLRGGEAEWKGYRKDV